MSVLDERGGSIRLNKLVDHLFKTPVVSVPYHAKMCEISYKTARQDIDRLISSGILTESENSTRPKYFFASHIVEIIFD